MNAQSREEVRRLINLLAAIKRHEERECDGPAEYVMGEHGVDYKGLSFDCGCMYDDDRKVTRRCPGNIGGGK